jgi:hypothetical protein
VIKLKMEKKSLIPRSSIELSGRMYYDEKSQAWGIIRLKSEIVKEFPQLGEKRSKFSYELKYFRKVEEFEKLIRDMKKEKVEALPVLVWMFKDPEIT